MGAAAAGGEAPAPGGLEGAPEQGTGRREADGPAVGGADPRTAVGSEREGWRGAERAARACKTAAGRQPGAPDRDTLRGTMAASTDTPMWRQYNELKAKHPDALLFFRMGDFYELFGPDAVWTAAALELTLTSRNKDDPEPIPMCGVPHHAAEGYIRRLLEMGFLPGTELRLVRRLDVGGVLEVELRGCRVSLRTAEAQALLAEPLGHAEP